MQLNYLNLISHEILPYVTLFRKKPFLLTSGFLKTTLEMTYGIRKSNNLNSIFL